MNLLEEIARASGIEINEMAAMDFSKKIIDLMIEGNFAEAAKAYHEATVRRAGKAPKQSKATTGKFMRGEFVKSFAKGKPGVLEAAKKISKQGWEEFNSEYSKITGVGVSETRSRKKVIGVVDDKTGRVKTSSGTTASQERSKRGLIKKNKEYSSEIADEIRTLSNIKYSRNTSERGLGKKVSGQIVSGAKDLVGLKAIGEDTFNNIRSNVQVLDALNNIDKSLNLDVLAREEKRLQRNLANTEGEKRNSKIRELGILHKNFKAQYNKKKTKYLDVFKKYAEINNISDFSEEKFNAMNQKEIANFRKQVRTKIIEKIDGSFDDDVKLEKVNLSDATQVEALRTAIKDSFSAKDAKRIEELDASKLEAVRTKLVRDLTKRMHFFLASNEILRGNVKPEFKEEEVKDKDKVYEKISDSAVEKYKLHKIKLVKLLKDKDIDYSKDSKFTIKGNDITWNSGVWKDGNFRGTWDGGTFEDGNFEKGVFNNGTFDGGVWYAASWKGGTWKNGYIFDWNKDDFVQTTQSPKEYSGSFQNVKGSDKKLKYAKDSVIKEPDNIKENKMESLSIKEKLVCESIGYSGAYFKENLQATNLMKAFNEDMQAFGIDEAVNLNVALYGEDRRELFEYFAENAFLVFEASKINSPLLFEGYVNKDNYITEEEKNPAALAAIAKDSPEASGGILKAMKSFYDKVVTKTDSATKSVVDTASEGGAAVASVARNTRDDIVNISKKTIGNIENATGLPMSADAVNALKTNVPATQVAKGFGIENVKNLNAGQVWAKIASFLSNVWRKVKTYGEGLVGNLSKHLESGVTWAKTIASQGITWLQAAPLSTVAIPAAVLAGGSIVGAIALINKLRKKAKKKKMSKMETQEFKDLVSQKREEISKRYNVKVA